MHEDISRKLLLVHTSGDHLYPVRMENQDTGRIAFRLSKKGNAKSDSIEVTDELEMINKVTKQNYTVRARTIKPTSHGGRNGLYRLDQRSIRNFQVIAS